MTSSDFKLIGRGLYSLREAHRLTGVPLKRIRRWTTGYSFAYRGERRHSRPVIRTTTSDDVGGPAIDFADLLEIRFLNAFREYGVSWKAIRIASDRARVMLGVDHPFSHRRFSTDGQTILASFVSETGDEVLIDLVRDQYELRRIIGSFMFGEIAFSDDDLPKQWWPLTSSRRVVIDPTRAFGAPIVSKEGVPTRILAKAVSVEGSVETVSILFDVDPASVADAVEYERTLAGM